MELPSARQYGYAEILDYTLNINKAAASPIGDLL